MSLINGIPSTASDTARNPNEQKNFDNQQINDENSLKQAGNSSPITDPRANLFPSKPRLSGSGGYTLVNKNQRGPAAKEENAAQGESGVKSSGPPSLMTPDLIDENDQSVGYSYSITTLVGRQQGNDELGVPNELLRDASNQKPWYDLTGFAKEPTTSNIIRWSQENDKFRTRPYKFTDFVFCKHWNKIPNNYMLTLRRFAYPVWDNMEFPGKDLGDVKFYMPIAQAITYMGEDTGNTIGNLLKFNANLKWSDLQAKVHEISQEMPGADKSPFSTNLAKVLGVLTGESNFNRIANNGDRPPDPYNNGPYANRVLGPVNRIDKVKKRDPGLEFQQSFSLKFSYVARPINGVNTKAVMLDIIANLLLLTYAEASFWGGLHRFVAGRPAYPFLGGAAGMRAWYAGDGPGFFQAVVNQFAQAAENLSSLFSSFLDDPISGLKSLASGVAELGIAHQLAGKKVQLPGLPALLTGSPVGEWHLTVGNPFNPMLMIGNLICEGIEFDFGEELGPDDFPLEVTATIKLSHGMPRDKAAIESMFNRGSGKIYTLPDELQKEFDKTGAGINAADTRVDKYTGNRPNDSKNLGYNSIHRKTILQGDPSDADRFVNAARKAPKELINSFKYGLGYAS